MFETFNITLSQCLVLFVFIAIGYLMAKTKKIPENYSIGISNLLVYIFAPCLTFGTLANNFKADVLGDKVVTLVSSLVLLLILALLAFIFAKLFSSNKNEYDIYVYSFMFPNSGYIGYPLVLAIFGEQTLFEFMIFCIPFLILIFTFGIYTLNPNKLLNLKNLVNPITVSLILGMIVGVTNINLPGFVVSIVDSGGVCMAPAAMLLTGMVFAANDLKSMCAKVKIYIACIIKLLIIPILGIILLNLLGIDKEIALLIIVMLSLPTGLNSIIFPEAYGGDSCTGAQLCSVSTIMCIITIPIVITLFEKIFI